MTTAEKLTMLKSLLDPDGWGNLPSDAILTVYLAFSEKEILSWRYSYTTLPLVVTAEYEATQIMAVIAGYGISGAEGQTSHSENGIGRSFKYGDMIAYIRANVIPFVGTI